MTIESVMPSNHLILCCPLLLPPSIFPNIRVFSNESVLHIRWPKYWSFSFNISPSNKYLGLISCRTDWISLQPKGLSRVLSNTTDESKNSSVVSLLYGPTFTFKHNYWKNHSFDIRTFVGQIVSALGLMWKAQIQFFHLAFLHF